MIDLSHLVTETNRLRVDKAYGGVAYLYAGGVWKSNRQINAIALVISRN
jgi:hypothetical protein